MKTDFLREKLRKTGDSLSYISSYKHITVKLEEDIEENREESLWFGGECVSFKCEGYVFTLSAIGDVYARLYKDGELVAETRDKNELGEFNCDCGYCLEDDEALIKAMKSEGPYQLVLDNNNWFECSLYDPKGRFYDLGWIVDENATGIYECILQILLEIPNLIADYEKTALE